MAARTPRICVVGSSNIDLTSRVPRLPKLGETMFGHEFHMGFGGKGANQAVMAARLGARVSMVTKLGRDLFGESVLANFRGQGLDTAFVMFDDKLSSGVAPIFVDDNAQNFLVIVPGANGSLSPSDVQRACDAILSADLLICQLEVPLETTLEAFRIAKSGGIRTILNPAPAAHLPAELFRLTDICAPNEVETEELTGQTVRTLQEAKAAAEVLLARGPQVVILTLGERGALVVSRDSAEHLEAVKVDAVDPTGAGDAFIGSLAVYLGEGLPLDQAVRRANAIAALSVTRIGAQDSFPNRGDADAFLQKHHLN